MDKEQEEQMRKGDDLRRLTESKEWGLVEDKFWEHINDMQSIMNIDPNNDLEVELKARQIAIEYMKDLWRDITGDVEQHSMNLHNENQLDGTQPYNGYGNEDDYIHTM